MSHEAINQLGITMTSERLDRRSDGLMADAMPGSRHWIITLTRGAEVMTLQFTQGPAHTEAPTLYDVLECIASDWSSAAQPFEDWCKDYGFNDDPEYDEDDAGNLILLPNPYRRIYDAVQAQALDLERLFSDDPDFDAAQFWEIVIEE